MKNKGRPTEKSIKDFVKTYNLKHPNDKKSYNASLNLVKAFPQNKKFEDIFIKVNFINGAFKTRIGDTTQVALNICKIPNLDKRIRQIDLSLIKEIEYYSTKDNKEFHFYSFATKYCHCHNPESFPIFDNYVKESLEFYRDNFTDCPKFATKSLRSYETFLSVLEDFKIFIKAKNISNSTLDRFLWAQSKPE